MYSHFIRICKRVPLVSFHNWRLLSPLGRTERTDWHPQPHPSHKTIEALACLLLAIFTLRTIFVRLLYFAEQALLQHGFLVLQYFIVFGLLLHLRLYLAELFLQLEALCLEEC